MKLAKNVWLSFESRYALTASKVSEVKEIEFKFQCKKFYVYAGMKIIERSPLKFKFVQTVDCLNLRTIASASSSALRKKFDGVLEDLVSHRLAPLSNSDSPSEQYCCLISKLKLENLEECAQFYGSSSNEQGLDDFYFKVIGTDSSYTALWEIVKVIASEAKKWRIRRFFERKRANAQVILGPATTLLKLKYRFFENLPRSKKTFILDVESIFEVNRPGPARP